MNFGVISTANIGRGAVIPAIQDSDHEALAVASRDADRAAAFAEDLGIPRSYGSYEELLADPDLDAVYNPLPNALHAEWTKRAADAGLPVLCEKPMGVDAAEAREMGDYCADAGVTLMEAFMYRYHPRTERAAEVVSEELTDVRFVDATFQFPLFGDAANVRLDPDLGGSSLLDVGCYAVSAARLFLGEPDRVFATGRDARNCGVETQLAATLEFPDGAVAQVRSSFDTQDTQRYRVEAANGWLEAEPAFVPRGDDGVTLEYEVDGRRVTERFDPVDQYRLEVEQFADCVASGADPRTDADEAVRNLTVLDALRESAADGEAIELA